MRYLPLALLLAGCAAAPDYYHHWTHANFQQTRLDADWYACLRENTLANATIERVPGAVNVTRTPNSDDRLAVQCMKARGYVLTGTDTNPS